MEIQIKKAVKAGNSSAVILPRSWLNKEVRIELVKKTSEIILQEVINIMKRYIDLKDIIGIYLTGSYARKEEDKDSDIDVLIITNGIDKEMINEGAYNIFVVSSELLKWKLKNDLFPIGQMIKECVPLLNENYLNSIEINVIRENIVWYLNTTKDKLGIVRRIISKMKGNKKYLDNRIAYTLVLRIRTMHIIKMLIKNEKYSKISFIKLINKISGGIEAYNSYLSIKNNLISIEEVDIEKIEKLCDYLEKQLRDVEKLVH